MRMNLKGYVRKWLWSNLKYHYDIFLEKLRTTTVSGSRLEPWTSQTRRRSANHSASKFDVS
jgi:hypothetical protein